MKANATGGTQTLLIENGVPYQIHTFTSSGVLTTSLGGPIQCLVVAGGGGGGYARRGNHEGGGGGAGGVRYVENITLNSGQSYVVTVGAGAAPHFQGSSSAFAELVSTTGGGFGGGGGGANFPNAGGIGPTAGGNGGSGGGGSPNNPGGTGVAGEGFAGALSSGGGGGGATGQGIARPSRPDGGPGLAVNITGTTRHYGGGGGGPASTAGQGGIGGGGRGGRAGGSADVADRPTSGSPQTGGGGGGGTVENALQGGSGGSGVVIVRYIIVGLAISSNDLTAGDTLAVSLFTENLADNTVVPYTISGIESSEINGAALTGNFVIVNNSATVNFLITTTSKQTKTITIQSNGSTQTVSIIENKFGLSIAASPSVLLALRSFIDIDFASRTSFNAADVADFDPPQYWIGA